VLPFRGNAFVDTTKLSPPPANIPVVLNCTDQVASDPNDIDFDITGCIAAVTQQLGTPNWLYGFQTFHAAADALFLINQVQGPNTCTWPGSPGVNGKCLYPTYVYCTPLSPINLNSWPFPAFLNGFTQIHFDVLADTPRALALEQPT
jgi:hypothetical protein